MKLGFIGLGIMGAPMALHLVNAGHQLYVNTVGKLPESISASTAQPCANAAEVTGNADIIFTMVPDTPDVEAVLFGASGIADGLRAGGGSRKTVPPLRAFTPEERRRHAAAEVRRQFRQEFGKRFDAIPAAPQ